MRGEEDQVVQFGASSSGNKPLPVNSGSTLFFYSFFMEIPPAVIQRKQKQGTGPRHQEHGVIRYRLLSSSCIDQQTSSSQQITQTM